ncbi:MAG TPA: beta-propeller domain-containing protein [Polyangia bacterium]
MAHTLRRKPFLLMAALFVAACGGSTSPGTQTPPGGMTMSPPGDMTMAPPGPGNPMAKPGQTDFTTDEAANAQGGRGAAEGGLNAGAATGAPPPSAAPMVPTADSGAPAGRVADVQEGDIYKVDQNRLFYLNTYRGFLIYDLNDPKNPVRVSRLPVYGYPIEMYVQGNTVYALLRDALYLTQVDGKPQFERHNVSQLVSIDISDLRNPRVIKTIDIIGNLREGVSRKVENTIYVVSYIPQSYRWGWRVEPAAAKEQAWVYSFNVADPANAQLVGQHKIFEGGSVDISNQSGSFQRYFNNVYISATANALMVAENWSISSYTSGGSTSTPGGASVSRPGCGSYNSTQQVHVSLIDISNPTGVIKPHVDFWTNGTITDQFKMTYVNDPVAKTGTFFGIVGRQVWASANCQGGSYTQNSLESWDVTRAGAPAKLDALDFGKPRETVRGTAFDTDRKVAYAITAEQIDPLYALDISNARDLKVLSEIDGLSGDMTVFRLVGDKKFLLGIGRDTSTACTGFQDTMGWRSAKIAVSIIDVQDLSKIRLVQRQCVAVKADWVSSGVTQDMDQAHKMLGMHADGALNVLTVPVSYSKRIEEQRDWWFYRWETAVGLMSWDLTRYDATKPTQTVIQNHGSYIHPHGEVRRSIIFNHEAAGAKRRMMVNLSDTHVSIADIQNLDAPAAQSEIEVAPYYNQIYRFGDYLVEQVQSKPQSWGSASQDVMTFRVKKAGGDMENAPALTTLSFGQIARVLKHDNSLVLFRQIQATDVNKVYTPPKTEAMVVDFSNPAAPRVGGRVIVPTMSVPYYMYWCGMGAYWGGFWFGQENTFATTASGFTFLSTEWRQDSPTGTAGVQVNKLVSLNVTNPAVPTVGEVALPATTAQEYGVYGLVPDPVEPNGFFLTHRQKVGEVKGDNGAVYTRYRYFAQRWEPEAGKFVARHDINTPGRLIRTWKSSTGSRMFLAQDTTYRSATEMLPGQTQPQTVWYYDYRLALLRQIAVANKPVAELLGTHLMKDLYPSAVLVDGDKLFLNARPQKNYYYGFGVPTRGGDVAVSPAGGGSTTAAAPLPSWETTSDRLIIVDTSAATFNIAYDQPTRMYNVQLMGTHAGKLFVNLLGGNNSSFYDRGAVGGGDGILVIDVTQPAQPQGVRFLRTLGYASHIEFFGDDVYVAAGHFGLTHMSLGATPSLPNEPAQM